MTENWENSQWMEEWLNLAKMNYLGKPDNLEDFNYNNVKTEYGEEEEKKGYQPEHKSN